VHGGVMKVAPVAVVLTHGMDEQELDVVQGMTGRDGERSVLHQQRWGAVLELSVLSLLACGSRSTAAATGGCSKVQVCSSQRRGVRTVVEATAVVGVPDVRA
jgi:hypothetical protein